MYETVSKVVKSENLPVGQANQFSVWILTLCKPSEGGHHLTLLRCLDKKKEKEEKWCKHGTSERRLEREACGPASKHFPHSPEVLTSPHSEWWQRKKKPREQQPGFSPLHSLWGRALKGLAERLSGTCRGPVAGTEQGAGQPNWTRGITSLFWCLHVAPVWAVPKKHKRRRSFR